MHELSQYNEKTTGDAAIDEPANFLQILNTTVATSKKEEPVSQKARRATFSQALRLSIHQVEEEPDKDTEEEKEIVEWANGVLSQSQRKYSIDLSTPSSNNNQSSIPKSSSFTPYRNLRQFRTGVGLIQLLEV